MGYRGEDASRTQADRDGQPPWQNDGYSGYGQYDDYGQADGADATDGADGANHSGHSGQYGEPAGYGYRPPGYDQAGYDQPAYDQRYGASGGYPEQGGGYGQPADYQDAGYPGQDAGNDWYGGQPAAASGASFADTGTYTLSGRIADEYGTGPSESLRDPVRGYPPSSDPAAPGFPAQAQSQGRPFPAPAPPPAASGPLARPRTGPQATPRTGPQTASRTGPQTSPRTGPQANPRTGPQVIPYTGQQVRYDGRDPRTGPGRDNFDDHGGYPTPGSRPGAGPGPGPGAGPDGYGGPVYDAFDSPAGYDHGTAGGRQAGYDDYAPAAAPYPDRGNRGRRTGRSDRGGRGGPSAPSRAGGRRPLLLAVLAVVVVIIIGAAAYLFLFRPKPAASTPPAAGPLPTAGATPSAQACVKKYGTYCHITLSSDDPTPLTISELFPPAFTNEADKNSFSLVSTKLDKTCSKAVIGQDLIKALKAGKCTQVVRASYVSGTGKIMGTIGVANLDDTNQAHYAGKVVGTSNFVAPLAAAKGVAKKLGQGTGVVEAEFKGHYLILTWSEFVSGSTPSTKAQERQLEKFSSDLVAGTANISLSQRMVTGAAPTASAAAG